MASCREGKLTPVVERNRKIESIEFGTQERAMAKTRHKLATTISFTVLTTLATALSLAVSDAGAADAFGPIESRSFLMKPGTVIERPPADCPFNLDHLFIRGTNVANAKSVDVSPKVWQSDNARWRVPTTECVAPNCIQLLVQVVKSDAAGPRTLKLKHADGRTLTATFDVTENTTGRCDRNP
jgi:hypothetical protein